MKKKLHFFRLASLLAMFAVCGQANALSWINDIINGGRLYYSELTVKKAIGEGTVYAEWGRTAYTDEGAVVSDVEANHAESMTIQSPDNVTARASLLSSSANHNYLVVPVQENGWEFENWYTDEDCTQKYTPADNQTFTYGGTTYTGYKVTINTNSDQASNRKKLTIYARFALNVTIGSRLYSTLYYSGYNFKVPNGITATTYMLDANDKLTVSKTYNAGDVIPKGEAVVLNGAAGTYKFVPVTGTYQNDGNNILQGSDDATTTTGGDKYYALQWSNEKGKVGFFWVNANGAAFTSPAHKAYLALSGSSVKGFAFDDDDATAIETVEASDDANGEIYNLAGQRINQMQRGINIVNGKKILKK